MRVLCVLTLVAVSAVVSWQSWSRSAAVDPWAGLSDVHRRMLTEAAATPPSERPRLALCFAPGTSQQLVELFEANFFNSEYQVAARWSSTANGGTGATGNPITLTYSFVPDGTSIPGGGGVPSGNSNLFAALNGGFGNTTTWQGFYHQSFQRWGELIGVNYVYEPNDDGAQLGSQPGVVGVRGDVRLAGMNIDGNNGILAYNNFPNNGDMVIDTGDLGNFTNSGGNYRFFRNVIMHEHGHGLGLAHVCPTSQTKLMEPFASSAFDGPQQDDILGGQRLYGDTYENNDLISQAADLGTLSSGLTRISASSDDNSDNDWYRFTLNGWFQANVTMRPIGTTYNQGAQTLFCGGGSSFNALTQNNLDLEVRDLAGAPLATANSAPAGQSENVVLTLGPGSWHALITSGGANEIQRYELDIQLTPTAPPAFSIDFSNGVPTSIPAGATFDVGIRTTDLNGAPDPASGQLFSSVDGAPFTASPLLELGPNTFAGTLPAMACGSTVDWYVSLDAIGGGAVTAPSGAPQATNSTVAVTGATLTVFEDQFQTTVAGWSIVDSSGLTSGTWERGVPVGGGTRGDPPTAYGGSGACYLTENVAGNSDVDNGSTTLISPIIDLSAYGAATLSFAFWYDNDFGGNPNQDTFDIAVSNNGGAQWTLLESYNASINSWVTRSFSLGQHVSLTSQMRVRFIASDPAGAGSVVEAGVDAFKIDVCVPGPPPPSLASLAAAAGTLGAPVLSVNDSTGGSDRRVDVAVNSALRMIVNQPAANPAPANFAVFGYHGVANGGTVAVAPGVGSMVFPLCVFDPSNPALFVFADSLGGSLCGGAIPASTAPWSLEFPLGVPTSITVTLQGVVESGAGLAVTNGIIVRIQ